jgi:RNA polymerase sigma-70 factor, ECF subfamily
VAGEATRLEFYDFDGPYLERLRSGDFRTQEHFVAYFTELIHLKLRSRVSSSQAIEDIRQETFVRVLHALRSPGGGIREPEKLGAFVNSICNNVLMEYYRSSSRDTPIEEESSDSFPDRSVDVLSSMIAKQNQEKVRQILQELSEKDRRILTAIFINEEDKDKVCSDFGVNREYLRVLLHRAKLAFKSLYLKSIEGAAGAAGMS